MTLQRGDADTSDGGPVEQLQAAINVKSRLVEDGVFGEKTEGALRLVQEWGGLEPTGVADDATLTYLGLPTGEEEPPPPPPAIVPSNATLVGDLGFPGGSTAPWGPGWTNMQNRDRNGAPGTYCTYSACVRNGGPGHETAARFEVRNGDIPSFGGGERSEVRAGSAFDVREGMDTYYEFSMCVGDLGNTAFAPPAGWGLLVLQWHSDEGSPPLSLHVDTAGRLSLENDRPGGYARPVCPIDAGVWHNYVIHTRWSRDTAKSLNEMWRDGQKLISYQAWNIVSSQANYLKLGIYRSAENTGTHVVWHDGLKVYRV